jgi:hypothetical protein
MGWIRDMNPVKLDHHNWFLKLLSFGFAMTLWIAVASETSSEIGIEVRSNTTMCRRKWK